jgi:hypothetical protein
MTKFSVTKNGNPLSKKLYTWDEKTKTFSSKEDGLVLDFIGIDGVTFKTGYFCTFLTGSDCTFKTGSYCTFNTDYSCAFKTGSRCTFITGYSCTFEVGDNCCLIRYDVHEGITKIPTGKKIKLNERDIAGYTVIKKMGRKI